MKTLGLLTILLVSNLANSKEINSSEFMEMFVQNREIFEEVKPGMSAEYLSNFTISRPHDTELVCQQTVKEVVISTEQHDKYLVYHKEVLTKDCDTFKKGNITENLEWRKRYTVEDIMAENDEGFSFKLIEQNGKFINTIGIRQLEDGFVKRSKVSRDMSKSQFYYVVEAEWGKKFQRLVKRYYTNPEGVEIENLTSLDIQE